MPKANVFNMAGEKIGEIELSEAIFGSCPMASSASAAVISRISSSSFFIFLL